MKPSRAHNFGTYFISSQTANRENLFSLESYARLLIETIYEYRNKEQFLLHDFAVMPDHLHLILTPAETLEKAMQLIKGGYSFRFRKQFRKSHEVWQKSFTDHRIRDFADYRDYKRYVWLNPVKAGLCSMPEDYPYSSASGSFQLDALPQRLKPEAL